MNKLWKPIALGKLGELKNRAGEIKEDADILSAVELIEMPEELKKELLSMTIDLGVILPPVPMGWLINTTEETIDRMIKKIRNYKEKS